MMVNIRENDTLNGNMAMKLWLIIWPLSFPLYNNDDDDSDSDNNTLQFNKISVVNWIYQIWIPIYIYCYVFSKRNHGIFVPFTKVVMAYTWQCFNNTSERQ